MFGSSFFKYFLIWTCRAVVICSAIISSSFNNFKAFSNPIFSILLEFPALVTCVGENERKKKSNIQYYTPCCSIFHLHLNQSIWLVSYLLVQLQTFQYSFCSLYHRDNGFRSRKNLFWISNGFMLSQKSQKSLVCIRTEQDRSSVCQVSN